MSNINYLYDYNSIFTYSIFLGCFTLAGNNVSITIDLDPRHPTMLPECYFLGADHGVYMTYTQKMYRVPFFGISLFNLICLF